MSLVYVNLSYAYCILPPTYVWQVPFGSNFPFYLKICHVGLALYSEFLGVICQNERGRAEWPLSSRCQPRSLFLGFGHAFEIHSSGARLMRLCINHRMMRINSVTTWQVPVLMVIRRIAF
jgi:hypothetical protein